MSIKRRMTKELGLPESYVDNALKYARQHVKKLYIDKSDGTKRVVFQPSAKLKTIQYWLIHNIFNKLKLHESAMAYRKQYSVLDNAKAHVGNRYFLKLDFKDFFNSIKFKDLSQRLSALHEQENIDWNWDDETQELVRLSCFYKNDRLAIGYPSSPVISNIVMYEFDNQVVTQLSDTETYGSVIYTRYADDLIFSTNKKGACFKLKEDITNLVISLDSPKIIINDNKTRLWSSSGGSANVTGLKVCSDGHITIHKKQKDHVRLLLSLLSQNKLAEEEMPSLSGHLAYIQHVAPAFYTKLQQKYFKEIAVLKYVNSI
jgi:RNA-directed DNA polymerase